MQVCMCAPHENQEQYTLQLHMKQTNKYVPCITCRSNVILAMVTLPSIVTEQLIVLLSVSVTVRVRLIVGSISPLAKQSEHCHKYVTLAPAGTEGSTIHVNVKFSPTR